MPTLAGWGDLAILPRSVGTAPGACTGLVITGARSAVVRRGWRRRGSTNRQYPESGAAIVVDSLLPGITLGEVTCPLFLTPHFRRHMVAA